MAVLLPMNLLLKATLIPSLAPGRPSAGFPCSTAVRRVVLPATARRLFKLS